MSTSIKKSFAVVRPVAERLVAALGPYCRRVEIAGSLRRQRDMVGDIEIVAIPRRPTDLFSQEMDGPTLLDRFLDEQGVPFGKRGQKFQQFRYGRYSVDLFLPTVDTWGSVFTIRTGSAEFTKWLVTSRAAGGACPDEVNFHGGRLYAHGRLLATPEESDVFNAVGLAYVPPAERGGPLFDAPRIEPIWIYANE
mgnify:CR=1 FL=1